MSLVVIDNCFAELKGCLYFIHAYIFENEINIKTLIYELTYYYVSYRL